MLKTLVKASQITNLTDARYFAALEVEWLGFHFDQGHDTYISPQNVIAIKEWVEGPKIIGEFGMQDNETIKAAIENIGLDAVQLGHFIPINQAMLLPEIPIIKEFRLEDRLDVDAVSEHLFMFSDYVETFLLKGDLQWKKLRGNSFSVEFLKDICKKYQVILAFNFNAADIQEVLDIVQPYGISITGGEEEAVGVKSFDELDELFEVIQHEEY